ncbi:T9SS type A sorting domain-containing protein [Adhaeribacter soli]|uniref:T9SS type A sorting domain-containing protein n=1 Tax=Adhaeribacter soli TaxID=2607655 RepID=A0A5N1J1N9_9BACT|nr:T9SS type A sorting domain-containing protein [Adhaeribacter soli]KAA9339987.1 T9SS type A sorting domain-containing protein [Adhaeribacter soli]
MKKLLLVVVMAVSGFFAKAQSYTFSQTTGTYADLPSPFILSQPGWDGMSSYNVLIPFQFELGGTTESMLGIGGNSEIGFQFGMRGISALLAELEDRNQSANPSTIGYKLTGTPGQQILKMEWKNAGTSNGGSEFANMQVWLYEGSNIIELHYGPSSLPSSGFLYFPQQAPTVGLALSTSSSTFTVSGIFLQGNPAAATAVTVTNANTFPTLAAPPASGTIYRFTPSNVTGLSGKLPENTLAFHPNPATDFITIKGLQTESKGAHLIVTDMAGRTMMSETIPANGRINIEKLAKGIYLARITANGSSFTKRLIKQ